MKFCERIEMLTDHCTSREFKRAKTPVVAHNIPSLFSKKRKTIDSF